MQFSTLSDALQNVSGASFIGIDTKTVPALTGGKKNPMQGRVTKITRGASVMVFQNKHTNAYENMVNRRLASEGIDTAFEVGPRTWGERIQNTPFVEHKGNHYLEVIFLKPGKSEYYLDDQRIDKSHIIGLTEKPEGEQGGLENKVIIRTFAVDNIIALRVDGTVFE